MMIDLDDLQTKLTPEQFKAPLFLVVCEADKELTNRVPFTPHEDVALMAVIRDGLACEAKVFDREAGGDELYRYILARPAMMFSLMGTCSIEFSAIRLMK